MRNIVKRMRPSLTGFLILIALMAPVAGAARTMSVQRNRYTATLLPDGKALAAGGVGGNHLSSAEVYDPATDDRRITDREYLKIQARPTPPPFESFPSGLGITIAFMILVFGPVVLPLILYFTILFLTRRLIRRQQRQGLSAIITLIVLVMASGCCLLDGMYLFALGLQVGGFPWHLVLLTVFIVAAVVFILWVVWQLCKARNG